MAKRDYYEVLGIKKGATEAEIKSAYRVKAKECHPDLHPNDKNAEQRFKEVNEAYQVLSDPDKRARYDQFGFDGPNMGAGGAGGFDFGGGFGGFSGFGDIFDTFFGGGATRSARSGPQRGADLRYDLTITFEEAANGCRKEFRFQRNESCETCKGSGAKPGSEVKTCPTCKGTGKVRQATNSLFGQMVTERPCSACGGTGKIITEKCTACGGSGRVRKTRTATVNVPAGIDDGQILTLSGQGEPGTRGGPAGDLYVYISVKPHKLFKRDGYNLYCEMPLSFTQAALGGEVEIPTLDGTFRYTIPEGTQNDTEMRFRGKGIQVLRGSGKGDLYVRFHVDVPRRLSDRQKELLRQFEDSLTGREYEGRRSFLDRVKEKFSGGSN